MTVVVVGAGLAGLRAAEAVRGHGLAVTVLGDERHLPYNRPPLSKAALREPATAADLAFRIRRDDLGWRLGQPVVGLDLYRREVLLADDTVPFDALIIATGIRPRVLPVPGPPPMVLRTVEDAEALRRALTPGRRLIIIGAGFIGCEVAATARAMGCAVTVCAADAEPMIRPLGEHLGAGLRRRHEQAGVEFHLGVGVSGYEPSGVTLSDGRTLTADVILSAVGSVPNTQWCAGNGLDLVDGVLTDNRLCAVRTTAAGEEGAEAPVLAVGDIARFPNPLFDEVPRRIEHWSMPTDTGRRAGAVIAALLAGQSPALDFRPLPSFWSDQYDATLQSFGMPALGVPTLASGSWDGDCIVEYHRDDVLVGVVGVNRTRELATYRPRIGSVSDASQPAAD